MVVAITGGYGFIGKYLLDALNNKYSEIRIINIDLKEGIDVLNKNDLANIEKFDCVVHLAAKSYVPASFENPVDFYYTNVIGTLNILDLCRRNKSRMIFFSSYVYGMPEYIPVDENHPVKAFNPYGQSKLMGESLCQGYHRDFDIPIIIFRPFNVYGIGQNPNFVISSIFSQIINGGKIIRLKDPLPKRDFVYIYDVISAIISAIKFENISYDVFNICTGESYSISELTEIINNEFNNDLIFEFEENIQRKNEVYEIKGNNNKIKEILNWKSQFNLKAGIRDMVKKIKK